MIRVSKQDYFARLPNLSLTEYTPGAVRVYGDFATQAGSYTFAWQGKDGETKEKRARFSFAFRRDPDSPTGWTIVEHHSSAMPSAPAGLKRARSAEALPTSPPERKRARNTSCFVLALVLLCFATNSNYAS